MSAICQKCYGTEFKIEGGAKICLECGEHQCDFIELLEDDEAEAEAKVGKFFLSRSYKIEDALSEPEEYNDWCSFEIYNVMLKAWTDVLISFGASNKFKEAVFTLWVRYLQKRRIAFVQEIKSGNKHLCKTPIETMDVLSKRDAIFLKKARLSVVKVNNNEADDTDSVLEGVKKKIDGKKERASNLNLTRFIASQMSQVLDTTSFFDNTMAEESQGMNSGIEDDEIDATHYESGPMLLDETLIHAEESNEEMEKKGTAEGVVIEERRKRIIQVGETTLKERWLLFSPHYLNLEKLLSIVYLALLIAEEDILLLDLLRWCREDHIPYHSAGYLIPKEKIYKQSDSFLINRGLPTAILLRKVAAYMACFLSVQAMPIPSMEVVAKQLINNLNLPESMEPLVRRIIKLYRKRGQGLLRIPPVEVVAAAAVLLAFKIVFGMDGLQEELLSDWAERLNAVFKPKSEYRLFSWRQWHIYMNRLRWWMQETCEFDQAKPSDQNIASIDVKRFSNYFWSKAIWKIPPSNHNVKSGKAAWSHSLLHYGMGLNRMTTMDALSQKSGFREYRGGKEALLERYVAKVHRRDNSDSKDLTLQAAEELLKANFRSHVFSWAVDHQETMKEFKQLGQNIIIIPVPLSSPEISKQKISYNGDGASTTVLVPDTMCSYWKVTDNPASLPGSFRWLLKLLSIECETTEIDVFNEFQLLERKYTRKNKFSYQNVKDD